MRKIWDIHGGIHPPENKTQSLGERIRQAGIPAQLILPLSQHIGAAAVPIVKVGDQILKGQCIARAEGLVSVPVHAPSSGCVVAIENRPIPHPSGLDDLCIVIDTDGHDRWRERNPVENFASCDKQTLLGIIRDAGIAGMGGAGFPTGFKLNVRDAREIDTLVLNGTECEPYITSDHALMRERAEEIAEGIAILAQLLQPREILLGVEDNKLDVVAGLQSALQAHDFNALSQRDCIVEVVTFPTKYPSGGEKQLIEILTGKQVPSGRLPADLGIVCQNLGTAVAIADAVLRDIPLISRITTITGEAVDRPCNLEVLLGTPVEYLLQQCGFRAGENNRLVMGGPMMGFALLDTRVPVIKTSNCILAPTEAELPKPPAAQPCIRCGFCAEACPASLLPQQLYWFAQGKELEKLEQHNIADCIECGACSYVCPSNIPLVQYYRAAKAEIRERDRDMQQAEYAKQRFDARQERLQRLEQEKQAARKARQAKAAARSKQSGDADPKAAAVAAALARVEAKKVEAKKAQAANSAEDDPVQRALLKRKAQQQAEAADPQAALQQKVDSAKARLEKAETRLADAQAENSEHLAAFEAAVEKGREKLAAAEQALAQPKEKSTDQPASN
ncbi:MAG: electron transport complex subunit RsxC [Gammaproteobacteria bacterium]|nr:electron transport complex subunit RsxC [Gammaproteobacteria bacterium]